MAGYTLILLTVYALCVALVALVARLRGADLRYWTRMGVIWGPFALPFACFARRKNA